MIRDLYFRYSARVLVDGDVRACDERGERIREEEVPAFVVVVRNKLARGVVDRDTRVHFDGASTTVRAVVDKWGLD